MTFNGRFAAERRQPVLYVTERCVFDLTIDGLRLIGIAPGIDLERDILARMDFMPILAEPPRLMDARIFADEHMSLRDDLLALPLEQRFTYDSAQPTLFLDSEALNVHPSADMTPHPFDGRRLTSSPWSQSLCRRD